jgi:hypothetical protein
MSPLAWFCGITIPSCVAGLSYGPPAYSWVFVVLMLFAAVLYVAFYVYWAVKDPDRLGSEAFVERAHMIRILETSKDPRFAGSDVPQLGPDPHAPPTKVKAGKP